MNQSLKIKNALLVPADGSIIPAMNSALVQFQCDNEEIIFPFAFIDPVSEVPVKWHFDPQGIVFDSCVVSCFEFLAKSEVSDATAQRDVIQYSSLCDFAALRAIFFKLGHYRFLGFVIIKVGNSILHPELWIKV